ncbi:MAG: pseudouridine synthase [Gemmatimonadota bacterium]
MRLQRYLSRAGIASRRAAEELIAGGRVRVDGAVVTVPGVRVDPARSAVEVDGKRVLLPPARWVAAHKPAACVVARMDPQGRPTVYDVLGDPGLRSLFHVGRLDFMSEGLLLLTNEGDVAHSLVHPGRGLPRRYEVTLAAPVSPQLPGELCRGVMLEDGRAAAEEVRLISGPRSGEMTLSLTLREGRNREIRRIMKAMGLTIHRLKRVGFGPVRLGTLKPGRFRELTGDELAQLRGAASGGTG